MNTLHRFIHKLCLLSLLLPLLSCQTSPSSRVLRVGVAPDYPPLAFLVNGEVVGIEADFAQALARQMKRKLVFELYEWDDLFAALDDGEVDILMPGVSITAERRRRYLFSEPYFEIGQMAMVRTEDAAQLNTGGALHTGRYKIGFVAGTTGETYVKSHLAGRGFAFANAASAKGALTGGIIDVFIHDAPTLWLLANNPDDPGSDQLIGLFKPLTREPLAWVFSKGDETLKMEVDEILQQWLTSGYTDKVINEWLPVTITAK